MLAGAASSIGEVHLEFSQPNQDSYLIDEEQKIYAVFDGHGDHGHVISSYLKNNLASIFSAALHPTQSIEGSLRHAFQILDENICKFTQSESSGSTCVMAYVDNNYLYVAGVGDCTAILVQANPTNGEFDTTTLLSSHKVNNSIEHSRILKTGAQVAGEYIICRTDPNKVINMTRAFGDQDMKSAGVISLPDISIIKLPHNNFTSSDINNGDTINGGVYNSSSGYKTVIHGDQLTYYDTTDNSNSETFLILLSDGLEQAASFNEISRKAHQIIKDQFKANKEGAIQVNTACSHLLKQLEDSIYDRDGIGFNDDTTVIVVLLAGFCT